VIAENALSWLWERWKPIVGIVAVLALFLLAWTCSRPSPPKTVVKATERNDAAKDQASIERRADDAAISNQQQEQTDVIKAAPKGETGPATRALNCDRWMRTHPGQAKPPGC
jgi:hypothetical protein